MKDIDRYYEILNLKPGASEQEVKQAYRYLAKIWHPDRFASDPEQQKKAEEEIKKINEAYEKVKSYHSGETQENLEVEISVNRSNPKIYYHRGLENMKVEKYQEAIEEFSQAIRLDPNYIEAYKCRGTACEKLGYYNRGKSDFRKALELELKQKTANTSPTEKPTEKQTKERSQPQTPTSPPPPKSTPAWKCAFTLNKHTDLVTAVAISRDGRTLASASFDRTILLWQLQTGKVIRTLEGHSDRVWCLAFSRNGITLASGSADKTIKLWQTSTGKLISTFGSFFSGHTGKVTTIAFSPDGQTLVSGSADKTIKLWNLTAGKEIYNLTGHSAQITSIAISLDGKIMASGGLEKPIRIRGIFDRDRFRWEDDRQWQSRQNYQDLAVRSI